MKALCLCCLSLTALFYACRPKDSLQTLETTVKVVDMYEKPLKDRKVRLFINNDGSIDTTRTQKSRILTTDSKGQAVFKYELWSYASYSAEKAYFISMNEGNWRAVNYALYGGGYLPKNIQIKMDTLKVMKMRLSSTREDVIGYYVQVYSDGYSAKYADGYSIEEVGGTFIEFRKTRAASILDTTFSVAVYANRDFRMRAVADFNSAPKTVSHNPYIIGSINRDSVFWIRF